MTQQIGAIGRFSSLASDPLRSFRFYAEFVPAENNQTVFDKRIQDSSNKPKLPVSGVSEGFVGGFTTISGLQINVQNIAYREGGFNTTVHQVPGMVSYPQVQFQRGVLFGNDQAMAWVRGMIAVTAGSGLNPSTASQSRNFRVNVNIYAAEHPNTTDKLVPKIKWTLHNAWITNLAYTDLNSVDSQILFETMTLVHEGLSVEFVKPSGVSSDPTMKSGGGRPAVAQ